MDPTWVFQSKLIPKNRTSLEWWMRKSICCFWREDRLRSNIFEHMTRVPGVKSWNPSQNWTSDGSPIFLEYETPSVIDDIIVTWETAEMNASDRPRCPKMCLADGLMPYLLRGRCSDSTICWWRTYHNMVITWSIQFVRQNSNPAVIFPDHHQPLRSSRIRSRTWNIIMSAMEISMFFCKFKLTRFSHSSHRHQQH